MQTQKRLIYLSFLSLFLLGLADNIRGPIFSDLIKDFNLSNSQASLFFVFSSSFSFFAAYVSQFFIKKWGRLVPLRLSFVIMIFGFLGIALSTSYFGILVASAVFGLSLGMMGVVQNVLVITSSPPSELQKWQSALHSMYGASSFAAPLLVAGIHLIVPGWRNSFFVVATLALILLFFSRNEKDSDINLALDINKGDAAPSSKSHTEQIYFAVMLSIYVAFEIMVSSRISHFARSQSGFSLEQGSLITSIFFAFLLAGRVAFIFWRPPVSMRRQMLFSLLGSVFFLLMGLYVNAWWMSLAGLSMAPFFPLAMTVAGRLFPHDLNSVTSYTVSLNGAVIVIMNLAIGRLSDLFGVQTALLFGVLLGLSSFALILLYNPVFKRKIP